MNTIPTSECYCRTVQNLDSGLDSGVDSEINNGLDIWTKVSIARG